jgi:hypothetical protein
VLMTNTPTDCTVRLRLFITPAEDNIDTQTTPELSFTDSTVDSCIVDNLQIPSCAVKTNGIPVEFTVNEYDNIVCLYSSLTPESNYYYYYDINSIGITFDADSLELSDPVLVNGITAYDQDYSTIIQDMDSFYEPNEPKCSFYFTSSITGAAAIQYEDIKSGMVSITAQSQARINSWYASGAGGDADVSNAKTAVSTVNLDSDTNVYDVNDMPPVFIDGTSCTEAMLLLGQCVAAPIVREVTRNECQSGAQIIKIGQDISVKDGDTGITPPPAITLTTDTTDFDFDGTTLSCPGGENAPELGHYVFNLIATEDDNQWRYSSLAVSVTIIDDPYTIEDIVTPPDSNLMYIVSAYGPAFVYDTTDSNVMTFQTSLPAGVEVKLSSNDNDFAIDNQGRVIYVGSPESYRGTS